MGLMSSFKKAAGSIGGGFAGFASGGIPGMIGGALGGYGESQSNKANSAQALRQMEFQERMSNTSHQREVKDLRAAGLNPMLSVNAGASSPGGAQAIMKNEPQAGLNSALNMAQIKQIQAQTNLTNKQASAIEPASVVGDAVAEIRSIFSGSTGAELNRHRRSQTNQWLKDKWNRVTSPRTSYKHNSIHKNRGKINRSAVAYPTEGKGSKSTPLILKHSSNFTTGRKRKLIDYNPGNSNGLHYWTAKAYKGRHWHTLAESKAISKSLKSNWKN